jgi:cephalosporin-C deacetylase-like acetyl esterase
MKQRIAKRIGLQVPENVPVVQSIERMKIEGLSVEKLAYEPEKGMIVPAVLISPEKIRDGAPVYLFSSDKGKPRSFNENSLIIKLAKEGSPVLAIDARGTGETCPTPYLGKLDKYAGFDLLQWIQDGIYLEIPSFGRTLLGLRTLDVMAGVNLLNSLEISKDRKIIVIGEGQQGLCSLLSSVYNSRIGGVVTIGTLTSYMELVKKQYYSVQNYFWVPGALYDFDIPDLARLVSAVPQVWINPVNGVNEKVQKAEADSIFGSHQNLKIITPDGGASDAEGVIAGMSK